MRSTSAVARPPSLLRRILRTAVVTYLLIVAIMMGLETSLVYPIPPATRGDWTVNEASFSEARFASLDGVSLHGFLFEHPQPRRVILYCHGNGEDVSDNVDVGEFLRDRLRATVLVFDYRGYGLSAGSPHEAGCVQDGLAASRWLAERTGRQPSELVLMGRSLGGGIAVAIAAEQGAAALVVQSTFHRMVDIAAGHYPWLPVQWIMRNRYDSLARIARYPGPLFASHGDADEVVPFASGQQLFDAAPTERKEFFVVPQGRHQTPQPRGYYERLAAFLDRLP